MPFTHTHWLVRWLPAIVMAFVAAAVTAYLAVSVGSNTKTLNILEDCLTPGGKCYERSQRNEQHVLHEVATIQGKVGVYVFICGHQRGLAGNTDALTSCVITLIKEHGL